MGPPEEKLMNSSAKIYLPGAELPEVREVSTSLLKPVHPETGRPEVIIPELLLQEQLPVGSPPVEAVQRLVAKMLLTVAVEEAVLLKEHPSDKSK